MFYNNHRMAYFDDLARRKVLQRAKKAEDFEIQTRKMIEYGIPPETVEEILYNEACPREEVAKYINESLDRLPPDYIRGKYPPTCFGDIKKKVEKTILTASIEKINNYFEEYTKQSFKDIKTRILLVREDKLDINIVLEELEEYLNGIIIDNEVISNLLDSEVEDFFDEKEEIELNLFGIWPVYFLIRRRRIEWGDDRIFKVTKIKEKDFYFIH